MTLGLEMITVDCTDPATLGSGGPRPSAGPSYPARRRFRSGGPGVVMADPDGNAFCVAAPRP
jgi:hypothetical protein